MKVLSKFRGTRIVERFAHIKIFLGTGQGYVSDFKYPVLLAIALKVYLPNAGNLALGGLAFVATVLMGLLGWVDLRFIKLAPTVAEIATRKYNPYFAQLEKRINGK